MQEIRILIVDDHPIVRFGISALIRPAKDLEVVAEAGNGEDAVRLHAIHSPDVTLMDLRLPGIDGVETIRRIRSQNPAARFIVLTTYEGDEDIYQAINAGAAGYLIKNMPQEALFNAVKRVHAGGRYLSPPMTQALAARTPRSSLSKREREVLRLLAEGKSNDEIGATLGITTGTAKCHVSVILERLNVHDRTQAVLTGLKRGLVRI